MKFFTREKSFYISFVTLTLMIALQNIIVFSVNLADNIMLGAYSETALSGSALVNQIQFFLQMVVLGVSEGMIVLCARYWGKHDLDSIRKVIGVGMRFAVCAALGLFFVAFFFPKQLLGLLSNETAVIDEGAKYLKIICFTYIFFAATNVLLGALRSVETVRIGFFVSLSTLIINVCLNYVLIYGQFGAPRLGIRGAAIATLTARIIELIIMVCYVKRFDKKLALRFGALLRVDMPMLKQYVRVSLPVIFSNSLWGIGMATQTAVLGRMGATAIAANSIAVTILQILSVITYASAAASSIIIGKSLGEMHHNIDMERIHAYTRTLQVLFLFIGVCTGLAMFCTKDFILRFYIISPETHALAVQFMNILSITIVGTSYQMAALTGIIRGGGDTRFVLYNDMIFIWLVVIPSAAFCAFVLHLPPLFVFICLKSDQILKCFVAAVKVNRYSWVKKF